MCHLSSFYRMNKGDDCSWKAYWSGRPGTWRPQVCCWPSQNRVISIKSSKSYQGIVAEVSQCAPCLPAKLLQERCCVTLFCWRDMNELSVRCSVLVFVRKSFSWNSETRDWSCDVSLNSNKAVCFTGNWWVLYFRYLADKKCARQSRCTISQFVFWLKCIYSPALFKRWSVCRIFNHMHPVLSYCFVTLKDKLFICWERLHVSLYEGSIKHRVFMLI